MDKFRQQIADLVKWIGNLRGRITTLEAGGGGGITDGDKGDIVVSGDGNTWNIDDDVITVFGRSLIDDADAATARGTLGLGNIDNTSDANKPVSTAQQTALDLKVDENAAITGATKTKITYDAKGLVTAGADATTADFVDSSNKRFVTDAQLVVVGNTSGTNTGDQTLGGLGGQPLDADLTAIAGLDSSTSGAIASDGAGWIKKTYAQFKTALGLVKGDVGLGNVDNTTDAGKPVSTAQQTALNLKANIASPTFTGTVGGITAAMVGAPSGSGTISGTNTGDQTITLTGPVTGSGTGSFATTITNAAVTLAKMADVVTASVFYRKTAGTGAPEVQTLATLKTDLGLTGTNSGDQTITLTGDVTGSGTGSFTATIAAAAVTLAKMANVATGTVFYRKTAATGVPEVQTLATLKTDLDIAGYTMQCWSGNLSPADAATIYIGMGNLAGTVADIQRVYLPKTGTLKKVYISIHNPVLGTAETSSIYFRYDNTTDTLISAAVVNNATVTITNNTALSVAVTEGHYFEIKWVCPTWATNPTTCRVSVIAYFE